VSRILHDPVAFRGFSRGSSVTGLRAHHLRMRTLWLKLDLMTVHRQLGR
jgi:hypothetical protein